MVNPASHSQGCNHGYMFVSFRMDCFLDTTTTQEDSWEASAAWVDDTQPIVDYSTARVIYQCEECGLQVYSKVLPNEVAQGGVPIYIPDFEAPVNWEDEL